MLSPDGHTRTFDADAQGTVFSDGAAVVLLKRLSDAIADGDTDLRRDPRRRRQQRRRAQGQLHRAQRRRPGRGDRRGAGRRRRRPAQHRLRRGARHRDAAGRPDRDRGADARVPPQHRATRLLPHRLGQEQCRPHGHRRRRRRPDQDRAGAAPWRAAADDALHARPTRRSTSPARRSSSTPSWRDWPRRRRAAPRRRQLFRRRRHQRPRGRRGSRRALRRRRPLRPAAAAGAVGANAGGARRRRRCASAAHLRRQPGRVARRRRRTRCASGASISSARASWWQRSRRRRRRAARARASAPPRRATARPTSVFLFPGQGAQYAGMGASCIATSRRSATPSTSAPRRCDGSSASTSQREIFDGDAAIAGRRPRSRSRRLSPSSTACAQVWLALRRSSRRR